MLKSRFWFSRSGYAWGSMFLMNSQINAGATSSWTILQEKGPQIESFLVWDLSIHNYNWRAGFADLLNSVTSDFPFKSFFLFLCVPHCSIWYHRSSLFSCKIESYLLSASPSQHLHIKSTWYSCQFYTLHPYISAHLSSSLLPASIPSRPTQPPNQANVTNLQSLLTRQI